MWKFICLVLCSIQLSTSKPDWRDYIPNGYNVPNPCQNPSKWNAVGHYHPDHHTLVKNQFGWNFVAEQKQWTIRLCRMDSDRDGRSNGEELGDPNCDWHEGGPEPQLPVGHPGICEPVGSERCLREQNFKCDCMDNCPNLHP